MIADLVIVAACILAELAAGVLFVIASAEP